MAGIVYLRTNRFEVKLEGVTFKAKDFESLCSVDFLFLGRKIWARPPIIGIDVMCHPRDPSIALVLLCFGVGCMILRFHFGDRLPGAIRKFLTDERIRFVTFGIPEKKDLFPFEELGLTKHKVDIRYLAAKNFNDSKYERSELAELARKVLRVRNMIGLTDASSFERHEQIKCSICQLFITSAIGMVLLNANEKERWKNAPKQLSCLNNLHSLSLSIEGWLKFHKSERKIEDTQAQKRPKFHANPDEKGIHTGANDLFYAKCVSSGDNDDPSNDECRASSVVFNIIPSCPSKEKFCVNEQPLEGIIKYPSSRFKVSNPDSSASRFQNAMPALRRANSKGFNVSFK